MYDGIQRLNQTAKAEVEMVKCLLPEFRQELNSISEQSIKSVTQNIIIDIMNSGKISRRTIDYTKKVTKTAQILAEARGYTSLAKDVITAAALLHDMYYKRYEDMHVFMIRSCHQEELRRLDPAMAENICSIIEGHHGYESIVPKVASKEGTIEQILTDAVAIAERL